MELTWLYASLIIAVCCNTFCAATTQTSSKQTNFVVFIMDDVGMGDLGCFGNDTMKTPNIDRLAQEGAKLSHHLALPLCTPSRAALMTGRLPVRYGMGSRHIMRVFTFLSAKAGLPSNETTIAELLKESGYSTGLVGKWHLGSMCESETECSHPNGQGFDYFFGLPLTNLRDCGGKSNVFVAWDPHIYRDIVLTFLVLLWAAYTARKNGYIGPQGFVVCVATAVILCGGFFAFIKSIRMMNCVLMENQRVVEQPLQYDRLTERLDRRAVSFLEQNHDRPFLLVVSFLQAHTALFRSERFTNHSRHGFYGDVVEEMDSSVGQVTATLKRLGLEDNTFVYLTSDNGGHVEEFSEEGEREGGWNGVFKGGKASTWEGGIRVPTIVKYPGVVSPGSEVTEPTQLSDLLPTIAGIAGVPLPDDRVYDGKDLMPLLRGETIGKPHHEFMYHYCGSYLHAARYTPSDSDSIYKVHFSSVLHVPGPHGTTGCFGTYACRCTGYSVIQHDPPLVYDLTHDPSELNPLDPDDPEVSEVISRMQEAVADHQSGLVKQQDQFGVLRLLPRPWKQPCCGTFPLCSCKDSLHSEKPMLPEVVNQPDWVPVAEDIPQS
ncbi:steryl-sulfatase-like [Patiria miniata]|uniref:Sulfatase N-terminal domain-containing protein n=1 Tax=Patiria miniata TaxID=46514 RepID=A0A914B6B1_PATMI|nr:steryl-sulfatase-like [Patiria miniata]